MPRGNGKVRRSKANLGVPMRRGYRRTASSIIQRELKQAGITSSELATLVDAKKFTGRHLLDLFQDFIADKQNLSFTPGRGRYVGKTRTLSEKEIPKHFSLWLAKRVHGKEQILVDRLSSELGSKLNKPFRV